MNRSLSRMPLLAVLLMLVILPDWARSDEIDPRALRIESVARLAMRGNPDVVRLQRKLDAAVDQLGWERYRDDLALALQGSVSGATLDELSGAAAARLNLAAEVIPQLTVTGELIGRLDTSESGPDAPYGASVGLILDPLADSHRRSREELAVQEATVELENAARGVAADAVSRLLAAVGSEARIPLLDSALAIARQRLERTVALAERDRATTTDVNQANDSVRAARQELERARLEADRARLRLAQSLRIPADAIEIPTWEELGIDGYADRIRESAAAIDAANLVDATEAVAEARINLESARIEAAATRRFTPQLSASAALTFPGPGYSLGMSLEIRPSDWDGSARDEATTDVAFAEQSYESAVLAKELDLRIARLTLEQAFENLEAARTARELSEIDLNEAVFLFERGETTALEVSQAALNLEQAEHEVWNTRAAVVRAWTALDLVRF